MPIPRHASIHVSWGDWGTLPLHHATGITCKIAGVELELYVITPSVQNQRAREDLSGASSPGDIALRSRVPVSGYRFSNFMLRHQSRLVSCRHYYLLDSQSSHRGPGIMVRVTVRVGDPCKASMVLNIGNGSVPLFMGRRLHTVRKQSLIEPALSSGHGNNALSLHQQRAQHTVIQSTTEIHDL